MNYCVVVKLSRRSAAFWYQTEGKRYTPLLMKGANELPLYFYVENSHFDFGTNARDRFFQNDPNAFGDYFELIKDPSRHFVLHGSPKRAKQLLYYGIEQVLSHFLNTVLYKSGSIESYRADFPLQFIFEADLDGPERDLIAGMFREAGYRTVSVWNYNQLLLEHLLTTGVIATGQAALLLTGLADDLYLELCGPGRAGALAGLVLPGQGADPRIRILAGMIVHYIQHQNPYLGMDTELEISILLPYCAGLLTSNQPILTGEAELSSGRSYWFRINLKSVEERLQFYSGDLMVATSINDLLQGAGIPKDEVVVCLCSDQIKTSYFSERLLKAYPYVKSLEPLHADGTMQLIFSKISGIAGARSAVTVPALPPPLKPKTPAVAVPAGKPPLPIARAIAAPPGKPPLPASKDPVTARKTTPMPPPLPPAKKK